jgi:hypothetical protein
MSNKLKHLRYKTTRKNTTKKTTRKNTIKKTTRKNTIKYYGGGNWVLHNDEYVLNDKKCKICNKQFKKTRELAIYQLDCKHNFHNNCLFERCKNKNLMKCPTCEKPIDEYDCTDVDAFKNKLMDEDAFGVDEIKDMYKNQEVFENR